MIPLAKCTALTRARHVQLCGPTSRSPPGSCVHGILQARCWRGLPFPPPGGLHSQGPNARLLRLLHWQVDSSPVAPPGKPADTVAHDQHFSCQSLLSKRSFKKLKSWSLR